MRNHTAVAKVVVAAICTLAIVSLTTCFGVNLVRAESNQLSRLQATYMSSEAAQRGLAHNTFYLTPTDDLTIPPTFTYTNLSSLGAPPSTPSTARQPYRLTQAVCKTTGICPAGQICCRIRERGTTIIIMSYCMSREECASITGQRQ